MREKDYFLSQPFTSIHKKKDIIIEQLRNSGCRITEQRKIILDIILENECSCSKEIYYQAVHKDPSIGIATVYRMIKKLEEIGAIDRKNQYQVSYNGFDEAEGGNIVLHHKDHLVEIKENQWLDEFKDKLKQHGYINNEEISLIIKVTA